MHVRTYGHHGFGAKLFEGELSEAKVLDFLNNISKGEWMPANNLPIIGYLDGIILKPHIYSQFAKEYKSRTGNRRGYHTLKLMGRFINFRAATGSCTEIEFSNEKDALTIWKKRFPGAQINIDDNYIFGKIINGKEVGFEYHGTLFDMPEWNINVIKPEGQKGYGRIYIGNQI